LNKEKRVKLISYTPEPEKICEAAARLSQINKSGLEIYNTDFEKKILGNVIKLGHRSVLEHAYFNFIFEDVSVFVEHFLIEFRLGSYTVKSRRYVDFRNSGYIIPEYLRNTQFLKIRAKFQEYIDFLLKTYSKLVDMNIPVEDSRFILPYCFKSSFFLSMNARELLHVLYSMIYGRGKSYPEIKSLGEEMLIILKEVSPILFDGLLLLEGTEDRWTKVYSLIKDLPQNNNFENNDKDKVEEIFFPNNGEKIICSSFYQCFNKKYSDLDDDKIKEIIDILIKDRRARELELVSFILSSSKSEYFLLKH